MNSLTEKAREVKEQISFTEFLSRLGHHPKRTKGYESMYISMVRDSDTDASFSVNEKLGAWYDHGMGKGGNIYDFGKLYWPDLNFGELVDKIREVCNLSTIELSTIRNKDPRPRIREAVKLPNYKIELIKPFGTSEGVNAYLKSRGVFYAASTQIAEVHYYVEDEKKQRKNYFAAGWQNELGGWEVRNKYFKGCLGKKAITLIPGDPRQLAVFEGYFNYLSWKSENPHSTKSVLVLNSLAMLDSGIQKAKQFSDIEVFMDHDPAGYKAMNEWKKALPYSVNKSEIYQNHNDYNDKLVADLKAERMKSLGR